MERYELKEKLGDGTFGLVMKGRHKETGNYVAIKHIKRKFRSWKAIISLREVQSLRLLRHPNIVQMTEVILERDEDLYFVFECMTGGTLYDLEKACIDDRNSGKPNRLTNDQIIIFILQILSALSYIHDQGFVHRDIKPENILLNENRTGCKVADFGLARIVPRDGDNNKITYYVSTRWYRAPEIILHCSTYGKPVDIFATGLILAELCSMRPLFPGTSELDQINKMAALLGPPTQWEEGLARMTKLNFRLTPVGESTLVDENVESSLRSTMPRDTPPMILSLIRQMIAWDPAARPVAKIVLQHEYFKPLHAPASKVNTSSSYNAHSKLTPRMKHLLTKSHAKPPTDHDEYFHCLDEIGNTEQIRKSNVAFGSSKSKLSNPPMSNPAILSQTENEFSRYLDAISNPISEAAHTVLGGREKLIRGNKVRSFLHSEEGCLSNDAAPNSFQPGIDLSIPSVPNNYFDNVAVSSMTGGVERLTPHRSKLQKHTTVVEKPRWLISNQNMSKRAMVVSITRQETNSNIMDESRDDRSEVDDSF